MLTHLQYCLPQHLLSKIAGKVANSRNKWLKNFLIQRFIKTYHVDMSAALRENPFDYPTFNEFFIRRLKASSRPFAEGEETIVSPVDGIVSEIGSINQNQLIQAKNFYFDLESLLGGEKKLAAEFYEGNFATFYLAPKDYHRVHMPLTGQLKKMIYVPGKLFSVNFSSAKNIPRLYSRNERVISIFTTQAGPMAIILVGALLVGNIQMVWRENALRHQMSSFSYEGQEITLVKGSELGFFKMGSTVIILFANQQTEWSIRVKENRNIKLGQMIGVTRAGPFNNQTSSF